MENLCNQPILILGAIAILIIVLLTVFLYLIIHSAKGIINAIKSKSITGEQEEALIIMIIAVGFPTIMCILGYLVKLIMC